MTKSTLSGIYDEDGSTTGERSIAETPWGTGAETPAKRSMSLAAWDNTIHPPKPASSKSRGASKPRPSRPWPQAVVVGKIAALFLFGVAYGVIVSHLHDTRQLAAVRVEGVDRDSWTYFASWGLAGIALGGSLPYVELVWGGQQTDGSDDTATTTKESELSFSEQWSDIVRSVGAFMGIAFAIVSHAPHSLYPKSWPS